MSVSLNFAPHLLHQLIQPSRTMATTTRCIASTSRARLILPPANCLGIRRLATPTDLPAKSTPTDDPLPHIELGQTHYSRYHEHYDSTLATDLMYMTYNHRASIKPPRESTPTIPKTPYEVNRPAPAPRGNRPIRPETRHITPDTVPRLESIILHTMVKEAIVNKHHLLGAVMALRAISGESAYGGNRQGSAGVEVLRSRHGAAAFKLRAEMPVSVKVEMKGEAMYDFIQSLVDFVMPRIREYPGIALPPASAPKVSPSALAGSVAFGFPPTAMGLFPQIEANLDAYPRLFGFHVHFQTNMKGEGAQDRARTLLSGFRIPFHRI